MTKFIIKSTNPKDTSVDIEEKLTKAVTAIQKSRDNAPLPNSDLEKERHLVEIAVSKICDNMYSEILKILELEDFSDSEISGESSV